MKQEFICLNNLQSFPIENNFYIQQRRGEHCSPSTLCRKKFFLNVG
jgi:hypothetical protein